MDSKTAKILRSAAVLVFLLALIYYPLRGVDKRQTGWISNFKFSEEINTSQPAESRSLDIPVFLWPSITPNMKKGTSVSLDIRLLDVSYADRSFDYSARWVGSNRTYLEDGRLLIGPRGINAWDAQLISVEAYPFGGSYETEITVLSLNNVSSTANYFLFGANNNVDNFGFVVGPSPKNNSMTVIRLIHNLSYSFGDLIAYSGPINSGDRIRLRINTFKDGTAVGYINDVYSGSYRFEETSPKKLTLGNTRDLNLTMIYFDYMRIEDVASFDVSDINRYRYERNVLYSNSSGFYPMGAGLPGHYFSVFLNDGPVGKIRLSDLVPLSSISYGMLDAKAGKKPQIGYSLQFHQDVMDISIPVGTESVRTINAVSLFPGPLHFSSGLVTLSLTVDPGKIYPVSWATHESLLKIIFSVELALFIFLSRRFLRWLSLN